MEEELNKEEVIDTSKFNKPLSVLPHPRTMKTTPPSPARHHGHTWKSKNLLEPRLQRTQEKYNFGDVVSKHMCNITLTNHPMLLK